MDFLRSLIGWSSDEAPPAASPQVLPSPAPNLEAKSKQPPVENMEKKKKTKQKKKKVEEVKPDIKPKEKSQQVESKEETINAVPQMTLHESGEGFTRVENKKKKKKNKNNGQRKGSNAKNKNNRKNGKNGSNKHENNQKRKNGKKKRNGNKNAKARNEFVPRQKTFLVRTTPPIEPVWAEHVYTPAAERQEQAWLPPMESFENRLQMAERSEFARQMQPSVHIPKSRGGPATLIPTPNESEPPFESYASLSEGPTIEAPATPTLFIGFDPENEGDHAILDRHLRAQATHGDFIEVWSSVLNDWTVAQIYECRDGTLSARYVSSPAFKIVERYDPTTWRPCRTNPRFLRKYDRSDVELKRLVKVYSESHEKWMLGHVVGAVESLEEGPLVHVRLLQHLDQVVDISLFSPYLIPLPKETSEELWRHIDAEEDLRSPTPPEREVIHFRRTRRLKEILFCKGLEKLNSMVEPVFCNQNIIKCIHSFGIDEKIEFDASFDKAEVLVATANHMQAIEFPGLTFTLRHLREDFLHELTKALDGQVFFRSIEIIGDKSHKMESFPLRVSGITSLEMHDVQLRDDEFREFLTTATKGGQMRTLQLYGVVDSTEKRDFVDSLRDEFPLLDICLSKDDSEEILA